MGLTEEAIAGKRALQERVFSVVLKERDREIAEAKLGEIYRELYPNLSEDRIKAGLDGYSAFSKVFLWE